MRLSLKGGITASGLDAAEIWRLAMTGEVMVTELTPQPRTLEQAFMDLTRDAAEFGVIEGAA